MWSEIDFCNAENYSFTVCCTLFSRLISWRLRVRSESHSRSKRKIFSVSVSYALNNCSCRSATTFSLYSTYPCLCTSLVSLWPTSASLAATSTSSDLILSILSLRLFWSISCYFDNCCYFATRIFSRASIPDTNSCILRALSPLSLSASETCETKESSSLAMTSSRSRKSCYSACCKRLSHSTICRSLSVRKRSRNSIFRLLRIVSSRNSFNSFVATPRS